MDFIEKFIDAMAAAGCSPQRSADIKADDNKHRIALSSDTKGKRNGVYQLKIEGDFAVGWFLDFKQGETHKWHSKSDKKITPEEREALRKKYEAQRKKRDREIKKNQDKGAQTAIKRWKTCVKVKSTPYSERKNIDLNTGRAYGDNLYCPIVDGKSIVNLQKIMPDGTKRFIPGAKKKGCWIAIGKATEKTKKIVICEGYATGESIYKATGFPVRCALDAGNIEPVAEAIVKKNPDVQIIIAADNDLFTKKQDGSWWNVGIEKGKVAAAKVGGFMIWPEFKEYSEMNDEERQRITTNGDKQTDFNDLHCQEGLNAVKIRFGDVGEKIQPVSVSKDQGDFHESSVNTPPSFDYPPITAYEAEFQSLQQEEDFNYTNAVEQYKEIEEDFNQLLICNSHGKPKPSSLHNILVHLKHNPVFKGRFVYNSFAHKIYMVKRPNWIPDKDFKVQEMDNVTITKTMAEMEHFGLTPNQTSLTNAIEATAKEHEFHPAREYFKTLEWDGVPRLETWLSYYLGCEQENSEYLAFVGKKWLCAAVKRVFEPGCKFDHMLVFEGDQGRGKSSVLEELSTFGTELQKSYFRDDIGFNDLGDKDTIMKVQGCIIIELAEMDGFNKKDDNFMKRWITNKSDDCRKPYGRSIESHPRQFVLAGTTNDNQYLKDHTGNRRYWPVASGTVDLAAMKKDKNQLWAEAYHLYKEGIYIGPEPHEQKLAEAEQRKRLERDIWEEDVLSFVEHKTVVKVNEILKDCLHFSKQDYNSQRQRRVAKILRINGFENVVTHNPFNKKTERVWRKKEEQPIDVEIV